MHIAKNWILDGRGIISNCGNDNIILFLLLLLVLVRADHAGQWFGILKIVEWNSGIYSERIYVTLVHVNLFIVNPNQFHWLDGYRQTYSMFSRMDVSRKLGRIFGKMSMDNCLTSNSRSHGSLAKFFNLSRCAHPAL